MLIGQSPVPLDDDQIAQAARMNRVYVNAICRQLAQDNLIILDRGGAGKIVNAAAADRGEPAHGKNIPGIPTLVALFSRHLGGRPIATAAQIRSQAEQVG